MFSFVFLIDTIGKGVKKQPFSCTADLAINWYNLSEVQLCVMQPSFKQQILLLGIYRKEVIF